MGLEGDEGEVEERHVLRVWIKNHQWNRTCESRRASSEKTTVPPLLLGSGEGKSNGRKMGTDTECRWCLWPGGIAARLGHRQELIERDFSGVTPKGILVSRGILRKLRPELRGSRIGIPESRSTLPFSQE